MRVFSDGSLKAALIYYGFSKLVYALIAASTLMLNASYPSWPRDVSQSLPFSLPSVLVNAWVHWDSGWYLRIARDGYGVLYANRPAGPFANVFNFFPFYPMAIRVTSYLTGEQGRFAPISALLISNAAMILALYVLHRLLLIDFDKSTAERTLTLLVLFPTAFLLQAAYYESLVLLFTVSVFFFARIRKWLGAGIVGMLLSLTMSYGVLILIPLLVEFVIQERVNFGALKDLKTYRKGVPLMLVPLGILIFMAYCYLVTGNWTEFASARGDWYVQLSPPWRALTESATILVTGGKSSDFLAENIVDFANAVIAVVIAVSAWLRRAMRVSYLVWIGLVLLLFLSAYRTQPSPYPPVTSYAVFATALWPLFLEMATLLRRRMLFELFQIMTAVSLTFICALFVNGYFFAI